MPHFHGDGELHPPILGGELGFQAPGGTIVRWSQKGAVDVAAARVARSG